MNFIITIIIILYHHHHHHHQPLELSNPMKQSPSWEENRHSWTKNFPSFMELKG